MSDVVVGVIALVIGLLLCFRGRGAMRVLLALWGAFIGFGLGMVVVAEVTGEGLLATTAGWVAAIVLAVVFAWLAFVFFTIAVVLAFVSTGFVLGRTVAGALGVSEPWMITLVGVLGGVVLGLIAAVTDMPDLVLVVLSALAGASAVVGGLMLLLGEADLDRYADTRVALVDQPLWYVGQLALVVAGIFVQVRQTRRTRTLRQSWG
ncbi:MAG: TM7S3/TM198-like domain-containing protein [Actinomycetaceae bacterium]